MPARLALCCYARRRRWSRERIPMLDINERLNNFENRLLQIEVRLGIAKEVAPRPQAPPTSKSAPVRGPETTPKRPWAELESASREAEAPSLPQHPATKPAHVQP